MFLRSRMQRTRIDSVYFYPRVICTGRRNCYPYRLVPRCIEIGPTCTICTTFAVPFINKRLLKTITVNAMSMKKFIGRFNKEYVVENMVVVPREIIEMILQERSRLMFKDRIQLLEDKLKFPDMETFWMFRYIFIGWGREAFYSSDCKFGLTLWTLKLIQWRRRVQRRERRRLQDT